MWLIPNPIDLVSKPAVTGAVPLKVRIELLDWLRTSVYAVYKVVRLLNDLVAISVYDSPLLLAELAPSTVVP